MEDKRSRLDAGTSGRPEAEGKKAARLALQIEPHAHSNRIEAEAQAEKIVYARMEQKNE